MARKAEVYEHNGVSGTVAQWASFLGLSRIALYKRIEAHWPDSPELVFSSSEKVIDMARPRKSVEQKVIEGTFEKRDQQIVPKAKPLEGVPLPPDHLSNTAKQAWVYIANQLQEMGVLTTADGLLVELMSETYARMRQAQAVLDDHGSMTYQTNRGCYLRPEVKIVQDCANQLNSLMSKCGMNPRDRGVLSVPGKDDDVNPFGDF
jgi:P27 family predicted phage terminase small subunit